MIEQILQLKGVDGYVKFNEHFEVLEYNLAEACEAEGLINAAKQIISNQYELNHTLDSVMLTERGVMVLSQLDSSYVLTLAGLENPVDVTRLLAAFDYFRTQLAS
ncbi:MAG: hypothetical protein LW817_04160 [Candidatus Caenarcaniphilales bacterium]|jgi:hypothetical protein|nr:hypothetical protein [Candidatus Caenarcaniphilales bacterium]